MPLQNTSKTFYLLFFIYFFCLAGFVGGIIVVVLTYFALVFIKNQLHQKRGRRRLLSDRSNSSAMDDMDPKENVNKKRKK